ncbi:MAG: hypothetical protein SNJ09_05430, partial [Rikenellaceae bacterium]
PASESHTPTSESHTPASESHTPASESHTPTSESHTPTSESHTPTSESYTPRSVTTSRTGYPTTVSKILYRTATAICGLQRWTASVDSMATTIRPSRSAMLV